jgi:hypothetical protein
MARKKKTNFRLNPEWMFKEPIDFEYNKYTLLDYLQKCENRFEKFEIYPDFIELSLHLANIQSLVKENTLLLTDKKFEDCDDEILVKELVSKKPPKLDDEELGELTKTLKFSTNKVFDTFNIGKSIWNVVHDNLHLSIKRNKENIELGRGFSFFYDKDEESIYVWEYEIKNRELPQTAKTYVKSIYEGNFKGTNLSVIISENTRWKENDEYKSLPIFEIKCTQRFPMKETFVPMMRRKIMSYIFQVVNFKKLQGIDSIK